MGGARIQKLVERFGTAARAFDAAVDPAARPVALAAARDLTLAARRAGARVVVRDDDDYPAPLLELPDPPAHLLAVGSCMGTPLVAGRSFTGP